MLQTLKFVQGAVAKKDFVPALTHFRIQDGHIKGYNGKIGLCSPIDVDLNVSPKAIPFVKAIQACKTTVAMHITKAGKLAVKSGKFRAYIECIEEEYPDIDPTGEIITLTGEFLPAIKKIAPFIAEDASRSWARGIMFRGQSAFATNNITLVEYWLGFTFPLEVNVPQAAIKELIRIGEEPTHLQVSENTMTFHYSDGRWVKTQLLDTDWPDLTKVLDREAEYKKLDDDFFSGIEDLLPFVDDLCRVFLLEDKVTTSEAEGEGASFETNCDLPERACFHGKQILLLQDLIDEIDLHQYPAPCLFIGNRLRGAFVGIRI